MILWLLACSSLREIDGEQPCLEAGYAISWRTFDCTNDPELANARYQRFEEQYECIIVDYEPIDSVNEYLIEPEDNPGNWFHCAFAIGELPCELVETYGDDLDAWLTASPVCAEVVR